MHLKQSRKVIKDYIKPCNRSSRHTNHMETK